MHKRRSCSHAATETVQPHKSEGEGSEVAESLERKRPITVPGVEIFDPGIQICRVISSIGFKNFMEVDAHYFGVCQVKEGEALD